MPGEIHSESDSTIPSSCQEVTPLAVRALSTWYVLYQGEV